MSKVFYKLDDIADFSNINNFFKLDASPTISTAENPPSYTLWTEEMFEDVFEQISDRSILIKETNTPWTKFKALYTQWTARNKGFIANELDSLLQKYNPIENYNSTETHSGTDTATKTPTDWTQTKTETPDNYKETTTQTPTNWQKQNTKSYTDYHETETQTPDSWIQSVEKQSTNNGGDVSNMVVPFNATEPELVSKTISSAEEKTDTKQTGTYETDKAITGTATDTETQSGTYQTSTEQTGSYETDKVITGSTTDTETQSGTYKTETAFTGSRSETIEQTGTFTDETEYGHIIRKSGNIGVTTSQQMIESTLDLYDKDFVYRWLMRFFNAISVYV